MIGLNTNVSMYFYTESCDMRKSFDGLCGIVINSMKMNPRTGSLYIFVNKPGNKMKILFWERHGFWLFYKRLEKGTFQKPLLLNKSSETHVLIDYDELMMIIEGIDLNSIYRRKRLTNEL